MTNTMFKAWAAGIAILLIANAAWYALLQAGKYSESSVLLLWISPLIAAFVASYFGPSKKILLGTSMAFPSAILAVGFNAVHQVLGNAVDFPGFQGALILFTTTLMYAAIISGVGGIMGYFLAKIRLNEK